MSEKPSTQLAVCDVTNWAIAQSSPEEVGAIIVANAGSLGVSEQDFERVTVPTGDGTTWAVETLEGVQQRTEISGIIVAFKDVRAMWESEYSGGGTPPDCASADGLTGVGTPGGSCPECPLAQFGSDDRGGRGQKCSQMRLLFILQPDEILPIIVKLPPTSLDACRKYLMRLSKHRLMFCDGVTEIKLVTDKNKDGIAFSRAAFRLAGVVTPEMRDSIRAFESNLGKILWKTRVEHSDSD